MAKIDKNAIAVCEAVNLLMKLIHCIKVDANKVKIVPWKSKQPNLEFMKYIKGGKYPNVEIGKFVYAVREVQYISVIQCVGIQLSVYHGMTLDY